MSSTPLRLSAIETFKGLPAEDLARLEAHLKPVPIRRGDALVREGEAADALYVIVSGRFEVTVSANPDPVAEISQGAPIGEIAFFAGGARTATVRAIRDSVVVKLSREDFDEISAHSPAIWQAVTATLAKRLAAETRKSAALKNGAMAKPRPRTLAIVRAGDHAIPEPFLNALEAVAGNHSRTLLVSSKTITDHVACGSIDSLDATCIFNELEAQYETLLFLADDELTAWSEKAIRQADELLLVGVHGDGPRGSEVELNALEKFAFQLDQKPRMRLALIHSRQGLVQGTRHWLGPRQPESHHHVALGSAADAERLWRFVTNRALGFVACGGGAYCAAHVGIYKALTEKSIALDIVGGTSGGAAMAAAFAQGACAADIDAAIHRMFIDGKALARYTLPRYSLLDHTHFDAHLAAEYGNVRIEDMWTPYFAVSMNLADCTTVVHQTGPVWEAIRASAAIPALLPPYYTPDGRALVDGSVVSNVPIDVMHRLKGGPNIVVAFDPPAGERGTVDYKSLPPRRELVARYLNPFTRRDLPVAPSAATVLIRSLMANHNHFERHIETTDWLLMPPTPVNMGALDWRRHSELVEAAYRYALSEIAKRST